MIIGSRKVYFEKLSSTNTHAAAMLRKGRVLEGTIVYTGFQTAGKGQAGNRWESEKDKNLLLSVILYPTTIRADRQFLISKVISLGVSDFLRTYVYDVTIKWPNDIYVKNEKIAGILIENSIIRNEIDHSIAGIGININQQHFPRHLPNPTSLKILTGKDYDLEQCLNELAAKLDARYKLLLYNRIGRIEEDYKNSLYRFGQFTEFSDNRGVFEGKIISVTDTGRIQIEDRRGRIYEYGFNEVDFL
ncbi:MAG TPA: biotin--[acetyl-CoA-carboxylase] ligase [Bacteroidales bacterium]|nr:biotin--[acetyl-CoA-carboxylase] ligase [Bacteroidales bacterium]HOK73673.1 biotin--[acetyl-CoA-carboxylase] ligase [Bacteroidales bacterium]HOM39331.1 biotin--[acetyl-CoA-carboxylase] ligase [Bacteroidales bacterium]HOU31119.1 biotin--[acetyl-CoA-carboxylase] ligase [Bacteroidales bacterium]HPP91439.1 biotin--[acetyl-CoA-carboxylase] ligase [Bacteroidales bacterium]